MRMTGVYYYLNPLTVLSRFRLYKIASLGRQESQPAGKIKWPTTLRFGKILGTTSVVRSIQNP